MRKVFKYLSYALVYLIVSLASAYGVITMSVNYSNSNSSKGNNPSKLPDSTLPTQLTSMVENLAQCGYLGLDMSIKLDTEIENFVINLDAEIDLTNGLERIAFEGLLKIDAKKSAQSIDLNLAYLNGKAYIDVFNGKFSFESATLMSSAQKLMGLLNFEMPDILPDLGGLEISELLGLFSNLKETAVEDSDLVNLTITLPMINQDLIITCDKEYKPYNISFDYQAENIKVTVGGEISYPDSLHITNRDDKEYIELSTLIDVAAAAVKYVKENDNYAFDIACLYNDIEIAGKAYINTKNSSGKIEVMLQDMALNLIYLDKTIYIEYGNVFAKFQLNDLDKVDDFLKRSFGIYLPLDKIVEILNSENGENVLASLSGLELDNLNFELGKIDLSMLESVYTNNDTTFVTIKNVGVIGISVKDETLSKLSFIGLGVNANLSVITYNEFSLKEDEAAYINLAKLLPTVENAINIFKSNTLSGKIEIVYKDFNLPINFEGSIKDEYFKLYTSIKNIDITIEKLKNKIYVNAGNAFKLIIDTDTIFDQIIDFLSNITIDVDLHDFMEIMKKSADILKPEFTPLLIKSLVETENGFVITMFNDLSIAIENGAKELFISSSVKGFDISASVVGSDESIVIPSFDDSQYTPVEDVLDLAKVIINSGILQVAEGAFNYFKDGKVALDLNASYADYQVNAKMYADILNAKAFINAKYDNHNVNILLENNVIYLEYQNIYAKFAINDLPQLLTMVNAEFGTNLPVDLIERVLTAVANKDMDALIAILTDEFGSDLDFSDVKLDISKIDKSFFENIVVDGNNTIVPIGDKTITFTVVDKMLTAIQFNGFGANVNAQTIEYVENNLSAGTESYIDLADFIPTIQNALQIVKSNTISGAINVKSDKFDISLNYSISKENEIYARISTQIEGYLISIEYLNGKVYLNAADKLMLVSEVATLPDAIKKFLADINLSIDFNTDEIINSLKDILDNNINPLLIKSLVETENGFVITMFNDLSIAIENGAKELFISSSVKGFDISASVVGSDESIVIPSFDDSQYTPVEDVLDLAKVIINSGILQVAEGAFNYFKDGKVALDLNASYADYQVNAKMYADILNAKAFINAKYDNHNVNILLENNVIYLEYQNIYAKFAINDLPQLLTMVNAEFGTNLPVDLIERVLTAVANKDMDALIAILTDEFGSDLDFSDVKLDISKIDKSFFENIVVDGNNTIVPIGDKTITFTVVDKMLTAIQFNGFGANVNAQTIEYVENNLSAGTESYIDLADFIPTIQNALQIVKSNTISGAINVDMNGTVIPVEINISKEAELYVELKTTVYNGVIEIYYYQNIVYLNLLNQIRLYSDLDTLPDALKELTEGMETLIDPILNLIGITRDTVESIEKGDTTELKLGADKIENKLILTINDMEIVLENNDKQLSISTAFGNIILNASISGKEELLVKKELNIEDYDPIEEIFRLFNAAKNMSKREDFHLTGYVDLKLFDMALDTIYFEVFIKVVNKNLELIVSFPNIPTIAFITKGLFENVSDRSLKVYYKDGNVFMHRTETRNKKLYEQCVKTTLDGFFADILNYVQFGFGFTDTIMNQMRKPAEKYRQGETIDLNNVLSGYAIKKTQTQTEYDMTFNLAEIVDNKVLGNLTLRTYIGEDVNGESYLQEMALQVSVLNGLVNISTPKTNGADNKDKLIKVVDYGKNIDANMQELYDYEAGYKFAYDTNMERTAGGEWTVASEKLRTLNFITNCDTTLPNISGVYNSDITLPTLENYQTDDGISHASFTFVGWYTSSNFEEDSLFESDKMPKFDTTLYAKWEEERRYYRTISFITNCNENFDAITDLEGNEIVLPSLSFKQEIAEDGKTVSTYSFEGWFVNDENGEIFNNSFMPNTDLILCAKWKLQKVEICNEFKLYDGDELLYSVYLSSGKEIDLAGIDKIKDDTKLYLDANFNDEFTGSLIMPDYNLNLFVRNQYTLSVKSAYGEVCDYSMSIWQGSAINIASQNSYYIDDGTQTKRDIFTFGGYNINGIIENDYSAVETRMPNIDYSVECVWDAETKLYYTVSFDLRWYEVFGCTAGAKQHTAATPIDPIRVLEDTELDLTVYQPTCKGYLTAIKIDPKTFKATSWGTSPWKNGVASNTGKGFRSIVITGDTTLYACWERV